MKDFLGGKVRYRKLAIWGRRQRNDRNCWSETMDYENVAGQPQNLKSQLWRYLIKKSAIPRKAVNTVVETKSHHEEEAVDTKETVYRTQWHVRKQRIILKYETVLQRKQKNRNEQWYEERRELKKEVFGKKRKTKRLNRIEDLNHLSVRR